MFDPARIIGGKSGNAHLCNRANKRVEQMRSGGNVSGLAVMLVGKNEGFQARKAGCKKAQKTIACLQANTVKAGCGPHDLPDHGRFAGWS